MKKGHHQVVFKPYQQDQLSLLPQSLEELIPADHLVRKVNQVIERVFSEHFRVEEKVLKAKSDQELSASSLQSPDDLEATYRQKGKKSYQGYVANLTETCDPENDLQLITKVQVAPNHTEDAKLLVEAIPSLKERTKLDVLYTDGGYGSPAADGTLQEKRLSRSRPPFAA
jgi:hypothetical protein